MVRVAFGLAAVAAVFAAGPATAGPQDADLWIGLEADRVDGFLLETDTGDLWMTGTCLKPLETAEKAGSVWRSRTAEMVSIGRAMTMLDQTFLLDVDAAQPTIAVSNPNRGGDQVFPAVLDENCLTSVRCLAMKTQPVCGN
jgi:hypothetical protein